MGHRGKGNFRETVASKAGKKSNCPFCLGRGAAVPAPGLQLFVVNGSEAGEIYWVDELKNTTDPSGWYSREQHSAPQRFTRQSLEWTLFRLFPLTAVPQWWPPFGLRQSFVLDEAAVWFCNQCIVGGQFVVHTEAMAEICAIIWHERIDIRPKELSLLFVAHGMLSANQERLEQDFLLGITALQQASGKRPVKKWRSPDCLQKEFAEAMRLWGRRPQG